MAKLVKKPAPVSQPSASHTRNYDAWQKEVGKAREKDNQGNLAAQSARVRRAVKKGIV